MITSNGLGSKFSGGNSAVRRTTFVRHCPMSARGLETRDKLVGDTHGEPELGHKHCYGLCQ